MGNRRWGGGAGEGLGLFGMRLCQDGLDIGFEGVAFGKGVDHGAHMVEPFRAVVAFIPFFPHSIGFSGPPNSPQKGRAAQTLISCFDMTFEQPFEHLSVYKE